MPRPLALPATPAQIPIHLCKGRLWVIMGEKLKIKNCQIVPPNCRILLKIWEAFRKGWGFGRMRCTSMCMCTQEGDTCPVPARRPTVPVWLPGKAWAERNHGTTYLGHLGHRFLHHLCLIRQGFLLLLERESGVQRGQDPGPLHQLADLEKQLVRFPRLPQDCHGGEGRAQEKAGNTRADPLALVLYPAV